MSERPPPVDAELFGTPLETIPMPSSREYPPGADMGELTTPNVGERPPPPIRVVTIEDTDEHDAKTDSGGADPSRPIGRGNPPRSGQQQRGAPSKNPLGRPPGIANPGQITRLMEKMVSATWPDGRTERMTRREKLLSDIARDAAGGDRHARRLVEHIKKQERELAALARNVALDQARKAEAPRQPPMTSLQKLVRIQWASRIEAIDKLVALRIVCEANGNYILSDWMAREIGGGDASGTSDP